MDNALDLLRACENYEVEVRAMLAHLHRDRIPNKTSNVECTSEKQMQVWADVMRSEGYQVEVSTNMVRGRTVGNRTVNVAWRTVT